MAQSAGGDYSAQRGRVGGPDISSGTTISVVIAATALLGLGGLVAYLAVRGRPQPDREDRLARAVDDMRSRMDDLGRDLSDALERAERESKRNRFLSDLGNSIEFEELLDRVLDAALEVPGFDAAMVVLDETGGTATMATRGMTPEEAAHPPSSGASGALPAGPITVSYRYGAADAADTHLIRGGLFHPLVSRDGTTLGTLALFWRTPGYEPSHERRRASPRSRTRAGTARRASSPRRMRSPGFSTSATSTRRSAASRSAPSATTAGSPSSSSTSTTSRR
jgi:hypothetical protein